MRRYSQTKRERSFRWPLQERLSGAERSLPRGGSLDRPYAHRLGRRVAPLLQAKLPPSDVVPGAQLVADTAVDADGLKAEGFVQPDAARIRLGDARVGVVEALQDQ